MRKPFLTPAVVSLLAANLVPLLGVLAFDWDAPTLLFAYWIETAVVSGFAVLKMLLCRDWSKYLLIPFFLLLAGFIMLSHQAMLELLLARHLETAELFLPHGSMSGAIATNALASAISHGASLLYYYIGRKEYRTVLASELFFAPFRRIIPIQAALFLLALAGIITSWTDWAMLVILVLAKTAFDLFMHLHSHGRLWNAKAAR